MRCAMKAIEPFDDVVWIRVTGDLSALTSQFTNPGEIIIKSGFAPKLAQFPNSFSPMTINISTWFDSCKGLRSKTSSLSAKTHDFIYDTKIKGVSPPAILYANSL